MEGHALQSRKLPEAPPPKSRKRFCKKSEHCIFPKRYIGAGKMDVKPTNWVTYGSCKCDSGRAGSSV